MKSKSTQKRSSSKKSSVKRGAAKAASKASKAPSKKMKSAVPRAAASSTAPVVYQSLRERVDAVNTNVGTTESLGDFLASTDW